MDVSAIIIQAGISHAIASESSGNTSEMNLSHAGQRATELNAMGSCIGDRNSGECGFSCRVETFRSPFVTLMVSRGGASHNSGASTRMYSQASVALRVVHLSPLPQSFRSVFTRCLMNDSPDGL